MRRFSWCRLGLRIYCLCDPRLFFPSSASKMYQKIRGGNTVEAASVTAVPEMTKAWTQKVQHDQAKITESRCTNLRVDESCTSIRLSI